VKPALTPDVRSGLGAFGRTARALVSAVTLPELARGALEELRDALGLEVAALYLPAGDGSPALERLEVAGSGREARARLVFDEEAWRLAVQGDAPLLLHERGDWLMQHPFTPPADSWLVLPLGDRLGVVIAAPAAVGPESGAALRLLGDLLGAGIATARLRQKLERTALERERLRLAAEVHDGLAQDLALAMRELALLDSGPAPEVAEASRARLRAAVASAHATVRSRLTGMVAPSAVGGLGPALEELCERFAHRGLSVRLDCDAELPELPPLVAAAAIRVVSEALANAERHAAADGVVLQARRRGQRVELVVQDDGRGFASAPGEGHFGLLLMRERARAAGGSLSVDSVPGQGTRVTLDLPLVRS
jgi:nitrate/nitrite-specific signal transduction histidine kinase